MIQAVNQTKFDNLSDLKRHLEARDKDRMNLQPKTYAYWQGDENTWNRKDFACKKIFKHYHKQNEEMAPLVEQRQKEQFDHEKVDKLRAKSLESREQRNHNKEMLAKRRLERSALQRDSGQAIIDTQHGREVKDILEFSSLAENRARTVMRSSARGFLVKDPPNLWNDFAGKSKKLMGLYLRPEMLRNEENSFLVINKKITEDIERNKLAKLYKQIEHDVVRHDTTRLKLKQDSKSPSHTLKGANTESGTIKENKRIDAAYNFFYKLRVTSLHPA